MDFNLSEWLTLMYTLCSIAPILFAWELLPSFEQYLPQEVLEKVELIIAIPLMGWTVAVLYTAVIFISPLTY